MKKKLFLILGIAFVFASVLAAKDAHAILIANYKNSSAAGTVDSTLTNYAQSFNSTAVFTISSIALNLSRTGSPSGNWQFAVKAGTGNGPTSGAISTWQAVNTTVSTSWSYVALSCLTGCSTTYNASTKYWIQETATLGDASNKINWGWANTGSTANGTASDGTNLIGGALMYEVNGTRDFLFSVTARDNLTGSSITEFNATINGTFYNTTNGTIVTNINNTASATTYLVNVTLVTANYYLTGQVLNVNTTSNQQVNLTPYATMIASNRYDNATITSFTVEYNGTNYTSNSTGYARIPVTSELYNFTVYSTNYIPRVFSNNEANRSTTYNASIWQVLATFSATEIISGTAVTGFTVTAPTGQSNNSATPTLYLNANTTNITFSKTGWYGKTQEFTFPALSTGQYNFTNTFQYQLNISWTNSIGGAATTNFTVNITSGLYTYNTTVNTTNGTARVPWTNDTNFNITGYNNPTVSATSILWNTSNYTNVPSIVNITLTSTTTNTFQIFIYNENTQTLITGTNISVYIIGDIATYVYNTSVGMINATLITPDQYIFQTNGSGYSTRYEIFTMTNQSTSVVNLYLLPNGYSTLTTTVSDQSYSVLPNYVVAMNRKNISGINYFEVERTTTDINGAVLQSVSQCLTNDSSCPIYRFLIYAPDGSLVGDTGDTRFSGVAGAALTQPVILGINSNTISEATNFIAYNVFFGNWSTSTGNITLYVADSSNTITGARLVVTRTVGSSVAQLYDSGISTGSTVILTFTGTNLSLGDQFNAYGYYYTDDGGPFLGATSSIIPPTGGLGDSKSPALVYGAYAIVLLPLFFIGVNVIVGPALSLTFLVVLSRIGIFSIPDIALLGFAVIGAVVLWWVYG